MLCEVDMREALYQFLEGKEVKLIRKPAASQHPVVFELSDLLKDGTFLVDKEVPAVSAASLTANVIEGEIVIPELISSQGKVAEGQPKKTATASAKPKKESTSRKPRNTDIDQGKLLALYRAGWPAPKIADEMGISIATVYNRLRISKQESTSIRKLAESIFHNE